MPRQCTRSYGLWQILGILFLMQVYRLSPTVLGKTSNETHFLFRQIISRGKGRSAVAAAAYRAGEIIKNEYDGVTHDYTRKRGIVHSEILLPDNTLVEYADRGVLWNAVEKIEKARK